jgi:oligoendopeptidase F
MDGVEQMLGKTDLYFQERFWFMRENGLLDLVGRHGKGPGWFCDPLPSTKNAFVFANFSPPFNAAIALIHELGHPMNEYLQ